jgi:prepilin-type N-terminal cleavage/methylation domain-containing protein
MRVPAQIMVSESFAQPPGGDAVAPVPVTPAVLRRFGTDASSLKNAGGPARSTTWRRNPVPRPSSPVTRHASGFTMVEIAICLAIIGIALVAIIGVLPLGINVQKDNREETLINQDATVFIENIRNGARGLDDLTNYVYAISNSWTSYGVNGAVTGFGTNGYTYTNFYIAPGYPQSGSRLTNGANIIGLLSTPEYINAFNGNPLPTLFYGGISNHVEAYVLSISGPAAEKPPQNNDIIRGDSFGYKMICDNVPPAVDTNLFSQYPTWTPSAYNPGATVSRILNGQLTFWQAVTNTYDTDIPGQSPLWAADPAYGLEQAMNLHEFRLTFLWPLQASGSLGNGRHTFATTVAGQIVQTNNYGYSLYFFQPQTFTVAP